MINCVLQGRGPSFSSSSSPSHTLSMEQLSAEQLALWWPTSLPNHSHPEAYKEGPELKTIVTQIDDLKKHVVLNWAALVTFTKYWNSKFLS